MSYVELNDPLWAEISQIAHDEGVELYDIEYRGNDSLRVFVHRLGKGDLPGQGGVSSEDCSRLCRRLALFFSVEGSKFRFSDDPELEVSSPGINRVLRRKDQFAGACGERLDMVVAEDGVAEAVGSRDKTRHLRGVLQEVSGDCISILEEDSKNIVTIPLEVVRKAKVNFPF